MSSLASFKRRIIRDAGTMTRTVEVRVTNALGFPATEKRTHKLRSWAITRGVEPFGTLDMVGRKGTKPAHRWLRRAQKRAKTQHEKRALLTHYRNLWEPKRGGGR